MRRGKGGLGKDVLYAIFFLILCFNTFCTRLQGCMCCCNSTVVISLLILVVAMYMCHSNTIGLFFVA